MKNACYLVAAASILAFSGETAAAAEEFTVCSANGNTTCETEHRICLKVDNGTEACGNCTAGYIELIKTECHPVSEVAWLDYVSIYSPRYGHNDTALEKERLDQLIKNLQFISEWQSTIPPPTHRLAPNKFSAHLEKDDTAMAGFVEAKVKPNFPRHDPTERLSSSGISTFSEEDHSRPAKVDWKAAGATTYVKDQGNCGCCWTIATAGQVEGATFIENTFIESLSFQQIISCDTQNAGCTGGDIFTAMLYVTQNDFGGLTTDSAYPFVDHDTNVNTQECMLPAANTTDTDMSLAVTAFAPRTVLTFEDAHSFEQRLEIMKSAVAQQPVTITMRGICNTLKQYAGGIMTDAGDCACGNTSCIDHGVLIVGYDDTSDPPSWLIKNSWGPDWGEEGYFQCAQTKGEGWGLFGILGQGVVSLKAVNVTAEEASGAYAYSRAMGWWESLLMFGTATGLLASFV